MRFTSVLFCFLRLVLEFFAAVFLEGFLLLFHLAVIIPH